MLNNEHAVCPNDPTHVRFRVTPHVTQDWEVDPHGDFQKCLCECVETVHDTDREDVWECMTCGAYAKIVPDEPDYVCPPEKETIAVCINHPEHDRFRATAKVSQDWEIDKSGNKIKLIDDCLQVDHFPDAGDDWECAICHGPVKFVEKEEERG